MQSNDDKESKFLTCVYYLARCDKNALKQLNFKTAEEAFDYIGTRFGKKSNTVKNHRDNFDPFFPWRKGWWQRDLSAESQVILDKYKNASDDDVLKIVKQILNEDTAPKKIVQSQYNSISFKYDVLKLYNNTCCISRCQNLDLLDFTYIKPSNYATLGEQSDLANALCLNVLYGKAFENGLITITSDYRVKVASELKNNISSSIEKIIAESDAVKICLPDQHLPSKVYLEWHSDNIFRC